MPGLFFCALRSLSLLRQRSFFIGGGTDDRSIKADAPNGAIAPQFQTEHHWRGVGEPRRSAAQYILATRQDNNPQHNATRKNHETPTTLASNFHFNSGSFRPVRH